MSPIILYRQIFDKKPDLELNIAKKYFEVTESRVNIPNRLVIARYSVWPFYKELNNDIELQGSRLINSVAEHQFITDFEWYECVKQFTPQTYFSLQETPKDENKLFVVKGRTKSKKEHWNTLMFAKGYSQAAQIVCKLNEDDELSRQGIVIRDYVPLKKLEIGINDMPFSNEWRFFYYKNTKLCHFFYWVISEKVGEMNQEGLDFAAKIANTLSEHLTFFVIDIAQKEDGSWILIEVNDAQSSGIPEENCDEMYGNLRTKLNLPENSWIERLNEEAVRYIKQNEKENN